MLEKGQKLNIDSREYTVLELLGQGANTRTYLALCRWGGLETRCILKEFSPQNADSFEQGKARFISAGNIQNEIRRHCALTNPTPPVSRIFEANGTAYIDVACFGGTTLDKLTGISLLQYMQLCLTITRTVGYYHSEGFLCLDLKPENIFVMQNTPDDTVTQLVEFIDYDSIKEISSIAQTGMFSYTRSWAAPEQLDSYGASKIGVQTDIFTLGEIVFCLLFGSHSTDSEHRGFSKYPFEKCKREYRIFTERPEVQNLFIQLFRGTLRSSPNNRFRSTSELAGILEKLCDALSQKDYIVPHLPHTSPNFVGRETEMQQLQQLLDEYRTVFVYGIGGIGKSTIVRNYIHAKKGEYDVIVYLESESDFRAAFANDSQLQISTVRRFDGESVDEYFDRKMSQFKRICSGKKALFVVDNYNELISKELSAVCECGYDTIIVSRRQPPPNSFAIMEIDAIDDNRTILQLISLNLRRQITKDETSYFEEIINWVCGHTLVIELISRQIATGNISVIQARDLVFENGFTHLSDTKIGNYKDGEEIYDTLSGIISVLFDSSKMTNEEKNLLKILALFDSRGLEEDLLNSFFSDSINDLVKYINELCSKGWIYNDNRVHVHPVISETAQNWEWPDSITDVVVMESYKQIIDIYAGMDNSYQIELILKDAEKYRDKHPRHFINAMYYTLLGILWDVKIQGAYVAYTDEEKANLEEYKRIMKNAIDEIELSTDKHKPKYVIQFYLDLIIVLIRNSPEFHAEAASLLSKVSDMLKSGYGSTKENECYFCMASAWFYTLAELNLEKTKDFTHKAATIAQTAFESPLEIIDITMIPTANCLFYHYMYDDAIIKLKEAINICEQNASKFPYIDKHAQLLNCMLDVYYEMGDTDKCRELIHEIDSYNEAHKEYGLLREVNPELRNELFP